MTISQSIKNVEIAIVSYGRAGKVTTADLVPSAKVWIPESQAEDYLKQFKKSRLVIIPDDEDGNPARKRNAVLSRAKKDWVLMLDDDITAFKRWDGGEAVELTGYDLQRMIVGGFYMAQSLRAGLWGPSNSGDPMSYKTYLPFSLTKFIMGGFNGHIRGQHDFIRYDEATLLREDWDIYLQHMRTNRKCLRLNYVWLEVNQWTMPGGTVSIRNTANEQRSIEAMKRKWGKHFKVGGSQAGLFARKDGAVNTTLSSADPGIPGA